MIVHKDGRIDMLPQSDLWTELSNLVPTHRELRLLFSLNVLSVGICIRYAALTTPPYP